MRKRKLTQKMAAELVISMEALVTNLYKLALKDAEETRLIEALETALGWGYIACVAKNGVEKDDE